jgi:hypothetical protein
VSFKDELLTSAADDDDDDGVNIDDGIDESGVDVLETTRDDEEEDYEDLLEDLPPPADLIDVIGPAPVSRLAEDIPEPAPRDPDLLLNMVTYREQADFREPVGEKYVDDFNGSYYPPPAGPVDRAASVYGSLRRNGPMSEDAASRFTYGTYRRHQMSRFQMSDGPAYGQPRRHRSSSEQGSILQSFISAETSLR